MTQVVYVNKDAALQAVGRDGHYLQHASEALRGDRVVVLEAVRNRGGALLFARPELQADPDIVLEAVRQHGNALPYASCELRGNKGVVLEALKTWPEALAYASDELRSNREVVLAAVRQNGLSLVHVKGPARDDVEVVLEAVRSKGLALEFAGPAFQSNKEVVLEAVKQVGLALNYASLALRTDVDVVLEAMKNDAASLLYASQSFLRNKDHMLLVARTYPSCLDNPGMETFREDKSFMRALNTAIAVQGERAPILSVRLQHPTSPETAEVPNALLCEASLMSGASFRCRLERQYSFLERWLLKRRPGPILDDLATQLLKELHSQTEVKDAKRIFINFEQGSDGDAVAVTPWDADRSLAEFLVGARA